jgi:hypothetical protein
MGWLIGVGGVHYTELVVMDVMDIMAAAVDPKRGEEVLLSTSGGSST